MTDQGWATKERAWNPLWHEQIQLAMDAATELKLALKDQGLTAVDLKRRAGVTSSVVVRVFSGSRHVSLGLLASMACAIGKRWEMRLVDLPREEEDR